MRKILLATAAGFAAFVADGVAPAKAQTPAAAAAPQPGFSVSVTGRLRFHGAVINQDGKSAAAGVNQFGNVAVGGAKLSNFDFNTYGRIRVDLSGRNADGIIYGGRIELRHGPQDTGLTANNRLTVEDDDGNVVFDDVLRGSPAGPSANAGVFVRVANGFIGTPTLGQLRFGSNGVLAVPQMFVGHIMGGIATGLLDGDFGDFVYQGQRGALANTFWYSTSSNVNRATGIAYYSPQFFGFDFGISYAANEFGFLGGCGSSGAAIFQCDRISTVTSNDYHRLRNIIDVMLRYRGTFGPVGVAASGGLRTAGTTSAVAPATARKNPTVGIIGAEVTYAGFTVGGITSFGSANRGFSAVTGNPVLPKAGTDLNNGLFTWQIGARYAFGPVTVGAAYHEVRSEGSVTLPANQKDRGFGIGGSYALGPGISLFAEYVNSSVRESGRDFNALQAGTQDKFKAQVFLLGVGLGF
jgi:predicted porin